MSEDVVLVERIGAVLRLSINRPAKRNALSTAVRQGLAAVAPFALAFLIGSLGAGIALWLIALVGLAGLLCLIGVAILSRPEV